MTWLAIGAGVAAVVIALVVAVNRATAAFSVPVDVLDSDPPHRLALFRFVSRFVIGHHGTIDGVLTQMARSLNE